MHDGDWDDIDLQATRKHYFGQNSLLAFEFKTASGPKTLLIRGSGQLMDTSQQENFGMVV